MAGIRTCDRESQVQRPNHYTTEPPRAAGDIRCRSAFWPHPEPEPDIQYIPIPVMVLRGEAYLALAAQQSPQSSNKM